MKHFTFPGLTNIATASGPQVHIKTYNYFGWENADWPVSGNWGSSSHTWAADFNGDGKAEIASASGSNVLIYLSTGAASTMSSGRRRLCGEPSWTFAADFTGDAKADLVSFSGCTEYLYRSTGSSFITYVN